VTPGSRFRSSTRGTWRAWSCSGIPTTVPARSTRAGPATPVTLGELVETCARAAGTKVEIVPVPLEAAPPFFPLLRTDRPSQQRSPARARAAGMPATALEVTAADVLAWDRQRGEPPLDGGFTPEQEQAVLARHDGDASKT
jgi:hypothetical protein